MSRNPRIRRELLDDDLSDDDVDRIEQAILNSTELKKILAAYNKAADGDDRGKDFYTEKIKELKDNLDEHQKKQYQVSLSNSQKKSKKQKRQTVVRGIVVKKFDGDWVWVEPKSAQKGEYGVQAPSHIPTEDLSIGTEVALNPQNFKIVDILKKKKDPDFKPAATSKTFEDVGGLTEVIDTLRRNVGIQLDDSRRAVVEQWGVDLDKCLMLVGPPGTGKTLLVKALANEYDADIFMVNGPQLVEKFIGEGAKKIRRLYDPARNSDRPAIIFIDEIDSIAKKRQENRRHGGEEVERTMSQLLSEIDGLDKEFGGQNVVSIFATNKPSILDPAIINRSSAIEVGLPDDRARREILQVHTRRFAMSDDVDAEEIVTHMPDDVSGRDIEQICKQAALSAIYNNQDPESCVVDRSDFMKAIQDLREGNIGMGKDFLESDNIHKEIFA